MSVSLTAGTVTAGGVCALKFSPPRSAMLFDRQVIAVDRNKLAADDLGGAADQSRVKAALGKPIDQIVIRPGFDPQRCLVRRRNQPTVISLNEAAERLPQFPTLFDRRLFGLQLLLKIPPRLLRAGYAAWRRRNGNALHLTDSISQCQAQKPGRNVFQLGQSNFRDLNSCWRCTARLFGLRDRLPSRRDCGRCDAELCARGDGQVTACRH